MLIGYDFRCVFPLLGLGFNGIHTQFQTQWYSKQSGFFFFFFSEFGIWGIQIQILGHLGHQIPILGPQLHEIKEIFNDLVLIEACPIASSSLPQEF